MMPRWKNLAMLGALILSIPAFGQQQPGPGALNYVEGAVFLGMQPLHPHDVGSVTLKSGQVLSTKDGKAEMLLTPGVFLRLDNNSAVEMLIPDLTHTQVELLRGRAAMEVDELYKQNDLEVVDGGVITQMIQTGYYEFDASHPKVIVFKGKAAVEVVDGKYKVVKGHHQFFLSPNETDKPLTAEKPQSFDMGDARDDLYNWNSLRSQYLAEANNELAPQYAGMSGFDPGWYWDPWAWDYTFIGMDPYWSPFGFGFFPPWYGGIWGGMYYGGGYYGGYYRNRVAPGPRAGAMGHGGFGGFSGGGGFGGGGFHGGGMRR